MTKEHAELLVHELGFLLKDEPVILVESREWEYYVPKHVSLGKVSVVSSAQEKQNHVLGIEFNNCLYGGLDYLVMDGETTIVFKILNSAGKQIYRSFTLARAYKDGQEMIRWIQLKFALI